MIHDMSTDAQQTMVSSRSTGLYACKFCGCRLMIKVLQMPFPNYAGALAKARNRHHATGSHIRLVHDIPPAWFGWLHPNPFRMTLMLPHASSRTKSYNRRLLGAAFKDFDGEHCRAGAIFLVHSG